MQTKATYKIKKNGKQDVFEGSLEDVRKWLRDNSINSSDAMRREGYQVLELDEFWGLVSDFPEFGMTEREGRAALVRKSKTSSRVFVVGILLSLAGLGLMLFYQWLPKYLEPSTQASLKQEVTDANARLKQGLLDAERKAKELIERERLAAAQALKNSDVRINEINALKADKEKSADALRGELSATRQSLARANAEINKLTSESDTLKQKLEPLRRERDVVAEKLSKIQRRIPINVTWRNAILGGYKVMIIRNHSENDIELSLVIKCINGDVLTREVKVSSGFAVETGRGENVVYEFKAGEEVIVTVKNRLNDFDARTFVAE
jgi:hypothetical protein